MSESRPHRWFQVSKNGKNCGVLLFSVLVGGQSKTIQVVVLPKFWSPNWNLDEKLVTELDLDAIVDEPSSVVSVEVCEMDFIYLVADSDEDVQNASRFLIQKFASSKASEPSYRLVEPVLHPRQKPWTSPPASTSRSRDMWRLFAQLDGIAEDLEWPSEISTEIPPLLTTPVLESLKDLRPLLSEVFVNEAERHVRNLRPEFTNSTDELRLPRGRISGEALLRRRVNRVLPIECEFDELSHQTPWNDLVLAASRVVAGDALLRESTRRRASSLAMRIPANIVSPRDALRAVRMKRISRKHRSSRLCFELAASILRGDWSWGPEESDVISRPGFVFGLSIRMDKVFERLLGTLNSSDGRLHLNNRKERDASAPQVKIHLREADRHLNPKVPDLTYVSQRGSTVLVDAKYKDAPSSFQAMPGSDQYQQYAYAATSGKSVIFCYVGNDKSSLTSKIIVENATGELPQVALTQIPFPSSENLSDWACDCQHLLALCLQT
jgi:McrBC 5-methylcytosine restriction system component